MAAWSHLTVSSSGLNHRNLTKAYAGPTVIPVFLDGTALFKTFSSHQTQFCWDTDQRWTASTSHRHHRAWLLLPHQSKDNNHQRTMPPCRSSRLYSSFGAAITANRIDTSAVVLNARLIPGRYLPCERNQRKALFTVMLRGECLRFTVYWTVSTRVWSQRLDCSGYFERTLKELYDTMCSNR